MPMCSAFGCKNRSNGGKPGVTFHRFPKNPIRRAAWVKAVRRLNWTPSASSVLCSIHFEEKDIDRTSLCTVRIREDAIPSVFPGFPKHMQKVLQERRERARHPPAETRATLHNVCHRSICASTAEGESSTSACREDDQKTPRKKKKLQTEVLIEESELCPFHLKFLKTVTVLDTDINGIHFCMQCGSAINEKKMMSASVVHAICKKGHDSLFTVEFSQRCHEWTVDCRKLDQLKTLANPGNSCHLCEDHFTCPQVSASMDSSATTSVPENVATRAITRKTSKKITVAISSKSSKSSLAGNTEYPSLPSSFFSVRSYANHLKKVDSRNFMVSTSSQTDGCHQIQACQEPTVDTKKHKIVQQHNFRKRKKVDAPEEQLVNPSILLSRELTKYLSGPFLRLVQEQLKVHEGSCKRWSDDIIALAHAIRGESGKAYDILQCIVPLPGRSVLGRRTEPPEGLTSLALFLQKTFPPAVDADKASASVSKAQEVEQTTNGTEDSGAVEVVDVIQEVVKEPVHPVATSNNLHIYDLFAQAAATIQEKENLVIAPTTSIAEDKSDSATVKGTT